jgi:hypothetical protein
VVPRLSLPILDGRIAGDVQESECSAAFSKQLHSDQGAR